MLFFDPDVDNEASEWGSKGLENCSECLREGTHVVLSTLVLKFDALLIGFRRPYTLQFLAVEGVEYIGEDYSGIRSRINAAALGSNSLKSSCRFSSRILFESLPLLNCEEVETEPIIPGLQ